MTNPNRNRIIALFDILIRRISAVFGWVSGSILLILALMVTVDVSGRYLFDKPLPAAPETSVLLLPWIVFPALICALVSGSHVRVSLFTDRLSSRVQSACLFLSHLCGLILFSAITYWGYVHFQESFAVREVMLAAISLPWWVAKLALPIGAVMIALAYLNKIIQSFSPPSCKKVGDP